jgi:phosphate transport system permease protein
MYIKRELFDRVSLTWMIISLAIILLMPVFIGTGLYIKAFPLIRQQSTMGLIFSSEWAPFAGKFGFLPFIAGSFYVTLISFLLAAPLCLLAAVYLTQYASRRLIGLVYPVIDVLAGLPSVIYGVWGILVIVPFIANRLAPLFNVNASGFSLLAGGIVLAVMCIPYMLNMLIEIFKTVPAGEREASLALGATRWESIKHVVLKKNYSGIISSFGLGVAKAFGETMAVMMVVGNLVHLPTSLFDAAYPLPALIANNYGEMLSIPMYDAALMYASFLLFVIVLSINLVFRYFIHRSRIR